MTGKNGFNPAKQLVRGDLTLGERTALVDLHWTKTLQHVTKVLKLPLLPLVKQEICPIIMVKVHGHDHSREEY